MAQAGVFSIFEEASNMSEEKMRIHTRVSQEMERKINAAMEKDN